MTRSIELKSITKTGDSHFLSCLIYFERFLNNEDKRYCFCLTAQRTQTIIAMTRQIELMRSTKSLLSFVLFNNMINFQNENIEEER